MDMLVKLYNIDFHAQSARECNLKAEGIHIVRVLSPNFDMVKEWVLTHFGNGWASECTAAFYHTPVSCMIAVKDGSILGFACYDATCKGFFGPTGVAEEWRGKGVGGALLSACMRAMWEEGYAYCVIGGVEEHNYAYYNKVTGAIVIDGSEPGVYRRML